jgi:hypothetical protein
MFPFPVSSREMFSVSGQPKTKWTPFPVSLREMFFVSGQLTQNGLSFLLELFICPGPLFSSGGLHLLFFRQHSPTSISSCESTFIWVSIL